MQVETTYLKTIKNYALNNKVTPAYIYKLIGEKKMTPTVIEEPLPVRMYQYLLIIYRHIQTSALSDITTAKSKAKCLTLFWITRRLLRIKEPTTW